ncbi:hypothetical protein [Massilia sp. BJB1822]|uniref:hypothetical protein n=1 Tax=Massilia sp. BJB1822 TaxID=2744470 RepID=UPI001594D6B8|nr:hypothetical protein [Massilia sp. BJB1822]NVD97905.1 hypothetical protein [Massilia sp. BJB1822]
MKTFIHGVFRFATALGLGIILSANANAECSAAKIKRLAQDGNTASEIADTCDMEKSEVIEILKKKRPRPDTSGNGGSEDGWPKGTPIGQCGCWGPVHPAYREAAPQCESGEAGPKKCPGMCPGGGYPWVGVCK